MVLAYPEFTVVRPPGLAVEITDQEWWFWERLHELEATSQLGGILAWKCGFHSTGDYNRKHCSGNYSIRDGVNTSGPCWEWKASALDWTFPEAHNGDYGRIDKYTSRLIASGQDANDPRLDLILYEVFGQADWDSAVEGWNEYKEQHVSSDLSHLWHIHFSFLRSKCCDFWAFWALLTVLMGWSVKQWQDSLGGNSIASVGGADMYMLQVAGNDTVYVSTSAHYRSIDWDTFVFYRDTLRLPYLGVPNQAALVQRGGSLLEEGSSTAATLSAEQMARIEMWIREAVGEIGKAEGTLSAEDLRRVMDEEAMSFEELQEAARAQVEASRKAVASANGGTA